MRRAGILVVAPTSAYLALMVSSVLGGPKIDTPLLPLPAAAGAEASQPFTEPKPANQPVDVPDDPWTVVPLPRSTALVTMRHVAGQKAEPMTTHSTGEASVPPTPAAGRSLPPIRSTAAPTTQPASKLTATTEPVIAKPSATTKPVTAKPTAADPTTAEPAAPKPSSTPTSARAAAPSRSPLLPPAVVTPLTSVAPAVTDPVVGLLGGLGLGGLLGSGN